MIVTRSMLQVAVTLHLSDFYWAPPDNWTQCGGVERPVYCKGYLKIIHNLAFCVAIEANTPSVCVCGDVWFNLCKLMTQCATCEHVAHAHPARESNQSRPGEAA